MGIFQYSTHGFLNIAAGVFNLTLGIIVLVSHPRSPLQRSFFLFTLSTSLWVIFYGFMSILRNDQTASGMLSLAYLGVPLIPATLHAFSSRLIGRIQLRAFALSGFLIGCMFMVTMILFRQQICEVRSLPWGRFNFFLRTPAGDVYFWSLIAYFLIYISRAYANFLHGWRNATSPMDRRQFRNILIGFSICYLGMLDFGTARGIHLYPTGYLTLTGLVGTIAYSIIRYQLWDINVTLKRASLLFLIYVFLLGFSVPTLFLVAERLLHETLHQNVLLFLGFSALFGLILSTGPVIYAYLERHTFWLKKHITTGLTHELKSPIGAIRGAIDLIGDQLSNPRANLSSAQDYIRIIDTNTLRLETFVKDLLHVAKGQDGVPTLDRSEHDLAGLLQEGLQTHQASATAKGLKVSTALVQNAPIHVDREKMSQVISNILSNAVKFSARGTIHLAMERAAGYWRVTVRDEGCGIPPGHLEQIFERFFQGRHANKGSGIGLTIAKAWVEAHGGKIWAESAGEGKGTTVTFTVPVEK